MWNELKIEQDLFKSLKCEFGEDMAQEYYADYVSARTYIIEMFYQKLKQNNLIYHTMM